ncbi:MAG: hypothetical protein P8X64_05600 [Anaerolineales bacterium]
MNRGWEDERLPGMTDNGSSRWWNWLLFALVILALIAIIVAVTLSQPTDSGSKSTRPQHEFDQLVTDVQARLEESNQQLTDLRSRAEKSSDTDLIGEIAQLEGMIAGIEQDLADLQSGTSGAWDKARSRLEAGMAEVDDFFQQLGDRLGSGFPTFGSRARRIGVSPMAYRLETRNLHAGVSLASATLHRSA